MTDITLIDGPLDGETRSVGEPWPREQYLYEDDDGELHTYMRVTSDTSEPYSFQFYEVTDALPEDDDQEEIYEVQEVVDPEGQQGEQGVQGVTGIKGVKGIDGDNIEFWTDPAWIAYLANFYPFGQDWFHGPNPNYDKFGWPLDIIPTSQYYGSDPVLGGAHLFDQQDVDQLAAERAAATLGSGGTDAAMRLLALPEGWMSPSGHGRFWTRGWMPHYGVITDVSAGVEEMYHRDRGGYGREGVMNPRYRVDHWHVYCKWMLRGKGHRVQLYANGVIDDDPYKFFTADSIHKTLAPGWQEAHPDRAPASDWQVRPGRESVALTPYWGPYTSRMTWKRMFRLMPYWRPRFEQWTPFSALNNAFFDNHANNFTHGWMKIDTDGWVWLVDYGPTYAAGPIGYSYWYYFFLEYESAHRPQVVTYE